MARLERDLGARIVKLSRGRVYLDELPPDAGRHEDIDIECSVLCVAAEAEIA